jgi:hypothetical protein
VKFVQTLLAMVTTTVSIGTIGDVIPMEHALLDGDTSPQAAQSLVVAFAAHRIEAQKRIDTQGMLLEDLQDHPYVGEADP